MIEENGGIAKGLDLSGRNLEGIDLSSPKGESGLDLRGVILKGTNLARADLRRADLRWADLGGANLQRADLYSANLQNANLQHANLRGASLYNGNLRGVRLDFANLQRAALREADLQGAELSYAKLQEADLRGSILENALFRCTRLQKADLRYAALSGAKLHDAEISADTKLDHAKWGLKHILGEEKNGDFQSAVDVYRALKNWHIQAGIYDTAGEFFFREMEAKRKAIWTVYHDIQKVLPKSTSIILLLPLSFTKWLWLTFLKRFCGYGERPLRLVVSALAIVLCFAFIYFAIGTLVPNTILSSLYYSAVSFTALGYGSWAPQPMGWVKVLGAFEAFVGVFIMALFLVTFVRKLTR